MDEAFTDMFVKNLPTKEKEYTRRERGGFGIRVLPSGRKVFFFMYRIDGQRSFLNLGTYKTDEYPNGITLADARKEYKAERAKVVALKAGRTEGLDPLKERREKKTQRETYRAAPTVSDLVTDYIERYAKRFKKSWKKDQEILNRDIIPRWGTLKAAEITKRDVLQLLESIVDRGAPAMANNCFQIVRKMFNWAVEVDILTLTPCTGVKLPSPKKSKDRFLSGAEIRTMWRNLDRCAMTEEIRRSLKLVLVTAQRPGEVIGMHTSEIDGRWWTIPVPRQKCPKRMEAYRVPHRVYLTDLALQLIGPLEIRDEKSGEMKPKGHIFPSPVKKKGAMEEQALVVAVSRALAFPVVDQNGNQLISENGKAIKENLLGVEPFTPHDLRRTASSFMGKLGMMDEVIDAVLNHMKIGMSRIYVRYKYDKEKVVALTSWERHLLKITGGKQVIPFSKEVAPHAR